MTTPLPEFHLHLVGRITHPPEAFDPRSLIGAAYAAEVRAEQERQATETALVAAEAELAELRAFVANAPTTVNMKRYGEARDRADLLERNLPQLRHARDWAAQVWAEASAVYSGQYGAYLGAVRSWNALVEQGLYYVDNQQWHVRQWMDEVLNQPGRIDVFEQQLRAVVVEATAKE